MGRCFLIPNKTSLSVDKMIVGDVEINFAKKLYYITMDNLYTEHVIYRTFCFSVRSTVNISIHAHRRFHRIILYTMIFFFFFDSRDCHEISVPYKLWRHKRFFFFFILENSVSDKSTRIPRKLRQKRVKKNPF